MINQKFHFISGLPRSGSTLLAAILRQNPRFHAAMSTPVGGLFKQLLTVMGANPEFSVFLNEEKKRDILLSLFEAYYMDIQLISIKTPVPRFKSHLLCPQCGMGDGQF
jgi:sulfotransferase